MSEAKQVIVFPRGQLSELDRARLHEGGFIAIEADDPASIVCVLPSVPMLSADDILMSALTGIKEGGNSYTKCMMVNELISRAKIRDKQKPSAPEPEPDAAGGCDG